MSDTNSREKKFTPGPWEVKTFEGGLTDIIAPHHSHWAIAEQVLQKDANLIAAAPELLEALENVLKLINCHEMSNCPHVKEDGGCGGLDEDCDWIVNSKTAVKKAYGETE